MTAVWVGWEPRLQSGCKFLEGGIDTTTKADVVGQLSVNRRGTRLLDNAKHRLHSLLRSTRFRLRLLQEPLLGHPCPQGRRSACPSEYSVDFRRGTPDPTLQLRVNDDHPGTIAPAICRESFFHFGLQCLSWLGLIAAAFSIEDHDAVGVANSRRSQELMGPEVTAGVVFRMRTNHRVNRPYRKGPRTTQKALDGRFDLVIGYQEDQITLHIRGTHPRTPEANRVPKLTSPRQSDSSG